MAMHKRGSSHRRGTTSCVSHVVSMVVDLSALLVILSSRGITTSVYSLGNYTTLRVICITDRRQSSLPFWCQPVLMTLPRLLTAEGKRSALGIASDPYVLRLTVRSSFDHLHTTSSPTRCIYRHATRRQSSFLSFFFVLFFLRETTILTRTDPSLQLILQIIILVLIYIADAAYHETVSNKLSPISRSGSRFTAARIERASK